MNYPKRLIEVDLPIKRISAHARREKSIRHGHISTLHIWWARRPLAACRAVICASLWPDPADPICPAAFLTTARAVKRNLDRFPRDFMFRLTQSEWSALTSQFAMSKPSRGRRRSVPYAFTEHGALIAANILNSPRAVAMSTLAGKGKSPADVDAAIRQIISRAVASNEAVDIFAAAGLKKPDISVLSEEFLAEVRGMPQKNLAVEMLRRLLSDEIRKQAKKNLVMSRSFAQLLEEAIHKYQNRTLEAAAIIAELVKMAKDFKASLHRGDKLGLNEAEMAFYDALGTNDSAVADLGDATLKAIARDLVKGVRKSVTIDWTIKEAVRAKIRAMGKRILRNYHYPPDKQEQATQTVLAQAEILCADWAT